MQLVHLLDTFNVDAYFNGHDHTQTHADPRRLGVLLILITHLDTDTAVS